MMKLRKTAAVLLSAAMLCAAFPSPAFAGTETNSSYLVDGMGDLTIVDYPGNTITYVYEDHDPELIKKAKEMPRYSDVKYYEPYIRAVSFLLQSGIIENQTTDRFYPEYPITVEEFASWIGGAYRVEHFPSDGERYPMSELHGRDLGWAQENGIIESLPKTDDMKTEVSCRDAVIMMFRHAMIEKNLFILTEYEKTWGVSAEDDVVTEEKIVKTFLEAGLLNEEDRKLLSSGAPITKLEAAHLLSGYIILSKKPKMIIGENVYEYFGNGDFGYTGETVPLTETEFGPQTEFLEQEQQRQAWVHGLKDVSPNHWIYPTLPGVYGIMKGVSDTEFGVNRPVTRAMFATILYRLDGEPGIASSSGIFDDVSSGQWYSNAVNWAVTCGIVKGVGNSKFDPDGNVTREQMAVMLKNYSDYKKDTLRSGEKTPPAYSSFKDVSKVSSWANASMKWAVENGLIKGTSIGLEPQATSTRAQVAQFIYNYTMVR